MRPVRTATFNGRKYNIDMAGKLDGFCDQYSRNGRNIVIMAKPCTCNELETLIHEGLHACNWATSEDNIQQSSEDISRFLWRLGYRRK